MRTTTGAFKYAGFCLLTAVLALSAMLVPASATLRNQADPTGKLTVVGKVSVDGQPAATGDILKSGSSATTAKGSSAVVCLGKLGRVEVLPSSTMKISYTDSSFAGTLDAGRANISATKGTSASISIKDGEVVADGSVATAFSLTTDHGSTCVKVTVGHVDLHTSRRVERITAGRRASIGIPCRM